MTVSDPAYPARSWTWNFGEHSREDWMTEGLGQEIVQHMIQGFEQPAFEEFCMETDSVELL